MRVRAQIFFSETLGLSRLQMSRDKGALRGRPHEYDRALTRKIPSFIFCTLAFSFPPPPIFSLAAALFRAVWLLQEARFHYADLKCHFDSEESSYFTMLFKKTFFNTCCIFIC